MRIILIKRKKRKKENIQFTNFRNICNITIPFELARGKFMDIENMIITKESSLL